MFRTDQYKGLSQAMPGLVLFSNSLLKMNFNRQNPPVLFIKLDVYYLTEHGPLGTNDFLSSDFSCEQMGLRKNKRLSDFHICFFGLGLHHNEAIRFHGNV